MRNGVFFLSFFCKVTLLFGQQDSFEQALDLIQRGSFKEALPLLTEAASAGTEPRAAFYLSQAWRSGSGLSTNDSIADFWLLRAARDGYSPAFPEASVLLLNPHSAHYDSLSGISMLKTCVRQKQAQCELSMARIYLKTKSKNGHLDSAIVLLKSLAGNQTLIDIHEILSRQDAIETLFDIYSEPGTKSFDEYNACIWFIVWTENMQLVQPANRELYFERGRKLYQKTNREKARKALLAAQKIAGRDLELPETLVSHIETKP